jgi:predicted metal-dependent enzyme (double-stranded beta helix superfamily)
MTFAGSSSSPFVPSAASAADAGAVVHRLWRLRELVLGLGELLDSTRDERVIIERGGQLLTALVSVDDWLPEEFARPSPEHHQQYLLHCDSRERFSVVSFVWGPGQQTPVHDHRVWGLVGVLRGAEYNQAYVRNGLGQLLPEGSRQLLSRGTVSAVSPSLGDLHRVENAERDRVSISIHVYGANIGAVRRATYDASGTAESFASGYSNGVLPNLWQAAGGP